MARSATKDWANSESTSICAWWSWPCCSAIWARCPSTFPNGDWSISLRSCPVLGSTVASSDNKWNEMEWERRQSSRLSWRRFIPAVKRELKRLQNDKQYYFSVRSVHLGISLGRSPPGILLTTRQSRHISTNAP